MYSNFYKRYITVVLLLVYIFNQTDRVIFGFLMEPIKKDLGLSDTQLGFLGGPALVLFYAALGVPVARLADRSSRVNIISVAVALWSCVVMATAAVSTLWHFALARIGVGVGEAGFTAVAHSLIAGYHTDKEQRTRALSVFMLGIPLGAMTSSLLAGWINELYGWRAVFVAAGIPGIALALLVKWTVREPPRLPVLSQSGEPQERPPLRAVFDVLWRRQTLRHLAIAQGILNVVANVVGWVPAFFMRNHHMSSGELGTWLAISVAIAGGTGTWLGGYLTTRYGAQDERVKLRVMALATALLLPTMLLVLWCPSGRLALLLFLPVQALVFFCYGPTSSFVQGLSPTSMRATMASLFILIQILAGGIIGVQALGILSDTLASVVGDSGSGLRWAMTLTTPLALWSALHFWRAGRFISDDATNAASGADLAAKSAARVHG
jgi:MFS family permease